MDPIYTFPASPGIPLFPVSPERANRQQLPHSPSLPADLSLAAHDSLTPTHSKKVSDVQGKVAQFNNLSKEAIQRRKDNEAALKRAVVGREEAESETRRLREESRQLRNDIEEGMARERRVGQRVETVREEMHRMKESQVHSQAIYEKEVRRARKEAFKSSSQLVKCQEELKTSRNKFTLMREQVEEGRRNAEIRDQETFAAQYQLVGMQEELESLKQQLKAVADERDMLKSSLKEEEIARIAAEGRIPLPMSTETDEFSSPKKPRIEQRRDSGKENQDPEIFDEDEAEKQEELHTLKAELRLQRTLHAKAEQSIEFLKMECQFGCCTCQLTHSNKPPPGPHSSRPALQASSPPVHNLPPDPFTPQPSSLIPDHLSTSPQNATTDLPTDEPLIVFSPTTGTFRTMPSPIHAPSAEAELHSLAPPLPPLLLSASPSLLTLSPSHPPSPSSTPSPSISQPTTPPPSHSIPHHHNHRPNTPATRIISHTTKIPLADPFSPAAPGTTAVEKSGWPFSPGSTMTREQALEQIRQRRGRARSIAAGNGTPRGKMVEGLARRDISAPTGGKKELVG